MLLWYIYILVGLHCGRGSLNDIYLRQLQTVETDNWNTIDNGLNERAIYIMFQSTENDKKEER